MKAVLLSFLCIASPLLMVAQTVCTISTDSNWSTCTCAETGLAPVNGNTIVVSAGITLSIDVGTASQPFFVGDINVFGVLSSDKSGAELDGNVHVFNGGLLQLNKQLSLGNAGGCGYTVLVDNGGTMTIPGSGGSALLSVCGVGVAQAGGGCNTYPAGPLPYCTPAGGWPSTGFTLDQTGNGGINYTWKGTTANWATATNWTPTRSTLTTDDVLTFDATGTNKNITSIPTQTVGRVIVTGSSTYSFTPAASGNTLTLLEKLGNAFQIDNGSSLTLGSGSNVLNLTMPSAGTAQIGGLLSLNFSVFTVSSATLILHTASSPLATANGSKITTNASTTLQFGTTGLTAGNITLPNSIFNGSPTIASLVMNTTSATLSDQPITVSAATFTFGILNTNSSGSIKFVGSATNPAESSTSYISGVAQLNSRVVGVGLVNFLGFSMVGGSTVGNMTIVRTTGAAGVQTFPPSSNGIAATWDITSTIDPAPARTFSFQWQPAFDNTNVATNKFQTYFNVGSGFGTLGTLQLLTSQGPPRKSATVSSTTLNGTFTLADQNNALPITLINFTAKPEPDYVSLTWATAAELNNDYFTVLHSSRGDEFVPVGNVKGNGTTNTLHNYTLKDYKPVIGKNYYQLEQTDLDGHRTTFETIVVDVISLERAVKIYPNPVAQNHLLNVAINGLLANSATEIQIVNMQGLKVGGTIINTDADGSLRASVGLTNLSAGLYILKVQNTYSKFVIE